jgi:predicted tellurium resistance membrane protein TerC
VRQPRVRPASGIDAVRHQRRRLLDLLRVRVAVSHAHRDAVRGEDQLRAIRPARPWLGLTAFWATVVKVELTDIVFAVDSILVAVAMSPKLWVIISGGILGIITMRMVIGQLLALVRRYPALVDGAFVIIGWVGLKLLIEFMHAEGWIGFQVNKWLSFGLIILIFLAAYLYARRQGPADDAGHDEAASLLDQK